MHNLLAVGIVSLLAFAAPSNARQIASLTLPRGARVGVVNLMDAEVTHFHASAVLQESFLKTHTVNWQVDSMFAAAIRPHLAQLGLEEVVVPPSEGLLRSRQEYFIDGSVNKGLPKGCAAEFTRLAEAQRVEVFVVLVPGVNDSAHAGNSRRKDLPDYLRGWGFVTHAGDPPGAAITVFNMTQVLLISATGGVALLRDREWGGGFESFWPTFTAPADLRSVPQSALDTLQPVLSDILARQASRLLGQVAVSVAP